jgi:glycosyltransferase involved in cell wall biosynthesis
MVSVAMTAFNSASWLPRAIDSVLQQKISFPIEIILGDDGSEDETVAIARSYQQRHPGLIHLIERPENIGIQRNYYETFDLCRGKYTAWLDADDYWTDPDKLAIQVELMESDPSISLCGHYIRVVAADGSEKQARSPSIGPGRYGLDEMLSTCFLPSLTGLFRTGLHRQLPAWYFELAPVTEWPLWVLAALSGSIVMIDRVMADYVHTPGSAAASRGPAFRDKMEAKFYEYVETILPPQWQKFVRAQKGKRYESLAYLFRQDGDFIASRQAALKAFRSPALMDNVSSKTKALLAAVVRETEWRLSGQKAAS